MKLNGIADFAANFFQEKQLKEVKLWKSFVDVFRSQPDGENAGWRGEYWGKMMRGATLVYKYTRDEELYQVLTDSVRDMITVAEEDGRVSSFKKKDEFDAWDLWCRKYVILACEYYLDICKDEKLKNEIITFISRCADCILAGIGEGEGQKKITRASRSWYGLNSSSILEPMVKLYRLTEEKKYLDFATYIVETGGAEGINVFEMAYENKIYPYQYGVSKAYEMMSCFEGLLEYYYVTGEEKYKTAVINFTNAVMETELSVIGCSGITHELFDHTRTRQTVRIDDVMQETCVTVTWMKLCAKVLELTGDSKYADCMEQSFYNAYMGSLNTEGKTCKYAYEKFILKQKQPKLVDTYMVVDSYSPLTAKKRGIKIGGSQMLPDYSYYGCCTCIASAGVGVFLEQMIMETNEGFVINFFEKGVVEKEWNGSKVTFEMETEYPVGETVTIKVTCDKPQIFQIAVRVPGWTGEKAGYQIYKNEWSKDEINITFEMPILVHTPETWDEDIVYTDTSKNNEGFHAALACTVYHKPEEDNYVVLTRGPLTLAADSRTGKPAGDVFDFEPEGELCEEKEIIKGVPCNLKMKFTDRNGDRFYLVDYASAGHDWESEIAAWLKTK